MNVLLTIGVLLAHAFACYGWGRGLSASLRIETDNPAVTVTLGLATTLALGGVCNLAGVAFGWTLWAIAGLGVVLGLVAVRNSILAQAPSQLPVGLVVTTLCLSVLVCVLTVSTLVPPWAFNYHDDYQKYFAYPVRMLQTGSLRGSSASALGFETLGGQAFLQGFVLSWGGCDLLNALDLGFAWPLCIALAGLGPCAGWLELTLRVLAMLLVLTLNPQIVNISATYTASALCLAWIELGRSQELQTPQGLRSYACASGLLFAGLCALKTTFFLLAFCLCALSVVALVWHSGLRRALLWGALTSATWALALLPWLAVHAKLYLAAIEGSGIALVGTLATAYRVELLSLEPSLYGGDSMAMYTFGVVVCGALAAYAWRNAAQWPRPWSANLVLTIAACLALVYVSMLYVVAPRSQGSVTIMRLFAPIFIALVTGCVTIAAQLVAANTLAQRLTPVLFALALLVPFVRGVGVRLGEVLRSGSILAFPDLAENENYIRYNYDVLYGTFAKQTALAQAAVPVGVPLLALINTPFWLDFKRNHIADLDPAGLGTPWARIPEAAYVLWEYNGFATVQPQTYQKERDSPSLLQARIGDAGLRLTQVLIALARSSPVLYDDGHTTVLKLPTAATLADAYRATVPTR